MIYYFADIDDITEVDSNNINNITVADGDNIIVAYNYNKINLL